MLYEEHVDLSDHKRIEEIISDNSVYMWEAVDSEKLGGWVPDIGLTSFFRKSIFRPYQNIKIPDSDVLSHRFWGTVENQSDHRGLKHIGILFYLYDGDNCEFELSLGAEKIGFYKPLMNDNNYHLIITTKKVLFEGEMEVFQFRALKKSRYRIEKFILLDHIPTASIKSLKIENINFKRSFTPNNDSGVIVVNFTTSEPSSIRIESDQLFEILQNKKKKRNFQVNFNNAQDVTEFTFKIFANSVFGNKALSYQTYEKKLVSHKNNDLKIPIYKSSNDLDFGKTFVFGVPMEEGFLYISDEIVVNSKNGDAKLNYEPISLWPDGSIKWAKVFLNSSYFKNDICYLQKKRNKYYKSEEKCFQSGKIIIKSQNSQVSFQENCPIFINYHRTDYLFLEAVIVFSNGIKEKISKISNFEVIHQNNSKTEIYFQMISFTFDYFEIKIKCYIDIDTRGVFQLQPILLIKPSMEFKDKFSFKNEKKLFSEENEILRIKEFKLNLPFLQPDTIEHSFLNNSNEIQEIFQISDLLSRVKTSTDTECNNQRFEGLFRLKTGQQQNLLYFKEFWQTYPKAISVSSGKLSIEILPAIEKDMFSFNEDEIHRLGFWFDDNNYLLKMGMNLSSSFSLDLGGVFTDFDDFKQLNDEILPCIDLDYLNLTKAYKFINPKFGSPSSKYEELMPKAISSFFDDRIQNRAFGHINFGDWYGESGFSWGNNEYDTALCSLVEFLRSRNQEWLALGRQAVRHQVDVDTISDHFQNEKIGSQAMHMPGHLGGYLPPYFKSKMKGTTSIPSHTWVEGLVLYYLLSGDESVKDAIDLTRKWLLHDEKLNFYEFSNCREAGWHLIHLCSYYEAFTDNECLNAAAIIVEKVLKHQNPNGGWNRMLTESHCGCGFPRCSGEAGFMLSILLSGLSRYYSYTGNEDVKEAVINGAMWLIDNTFDELSGHFRYTSCEKRTLGGGFQQTQWVIESLAYAYYFSKSDLIEKYLRNSIPTIGEYPKNLDHLGLGKALAQQMRYTPFILHMLPKDE